VVEKHEYGTGLIGKITPIGSGNNLTTIVDTIIDKGYTGIFIDNRMEALIGSWII